MATLDELADYLAEWAKLPTPKERQDKNMKPSTLKLSNGAYFKDERHEYRINKGGSTKTFTDGARLVDYDLELEQYVRPDIPTGMWSKKAGIALGVCRPSYSDPLFVAPPPKSMISKPITGAEDWLTLRDPISRGFISSYGAVVDALWKDNVVIPMRGTDDTALDWWDFQYILVRFYGYALDQV